MFLPEADNDEPASITSTITADFPSNVQNQSGSSSIQDNVNAKQGNLFCLKCQTCIQGPLV